MKNEHLKIALVSIGFGTITYMFRENLRTSLWISFFVLNLYYLHGNYLKQDYDNLNDKISSVSCLACTIIFFSTIFSLLAYEIINSINN